MSKMFRKMPTQTCTEQPPPVTSYPATSSWTHMKRSSGVPAKGQGSWYRFSMFVQTRKLVVLFWKLTDHRNQICAFYVYMNVHEFSMIFFLTIWLASSKQKPCSSKFQSSERRPFSTKVSLWPNHVKTPKRDEDIPRVVHGVCCQCLRKILEMHGSAWKCHP